MVNGRNVHGYVYIKIKKWQYVKHKKEQILNVGLKKSGPTKKVILAVLLSAKV